MPINIALSATPRNSFGHAQLRAHVAGALEQPVAAVLTGDTSADRQVKKSVLLLGISSVGGD
jgi:hypothetical protein